MSWATDLSWRVKSKGNDGNGGLFCQLNLVGNYLMLGFCFSMQQDLCTLTKPPSAGLVSNTISCRNLTVQQANYFFGMWPFHYRRWDSEWGFHHDNMTCWQTVSETLLALVYWSDGKNTSLCKLTVYMLVDRGGGCQLKTYTHAEKTHQLPKWDRKDQQKKGVATLWKHTCTYNKKVHTLVK